MARWATSHVDVSKADQALAEVLAWVDVVNERWADAEAVPAFSRRQLASTGAPSGDAIKKPHKWIERLMPKLRDLFRSMPEAQSFSITAGAPRLAVTVTFVPVTFESPLRSPRSGGRAPVSHQSGPQTRPL